METKKSKKQQIREQVYQKYGCRCGYCGKELKSIKDMQIDHIEPLWKAITSEDYKNAQVFENLMPSCRRCNHYKRADNLEQFRFKMKTIHERVCSNYIVKVALDYGIIQIKPFHELFYFETYK